MISSKFFHQAAAIPDITLRGMSPAVHRALKEAAERNHRSLNGEVLARLEASVRPTSVDVATLLARVRAREARLGSLQLPEEDLRALKDRGRP